MGNVNRIYIFDGYRDTVIESQVFNWASALNSIGLKTTGLSLSKGKKDDAINRTKLEHLSQKYNIDVYSYQFDNKPLIRELQIIIILLRTYFRLKKKQEKIVFQTRMMGLIYIAPVCRILLGVKFIFDMRGSLVTEYLYSKSDLSQGDSKVMVLKRLERQIVYGSDAVFCVSDVLREYLINNYGSKSLKSSKLTVIPGAADQSYFYFSEILRNETRKQLSCNDKVVYLYSGRLDKHWQIPDKIFELFSYIYKHSVNAFFVILTPDTLIADKYCQACEIDKGSYITTYVELDGISPYLNAADYAVVLRENLPINHQASPTKISEYLLTGLSVIISKNVGDFSGFIEKNQLGFVVDIDKPDYCEWVTNQLNENMEIKVDAENTRIARANLSAQYYAKSKYLELIKQICTDI